MNLSKNSPLCFQYSFFLRKNVLSFATSPLLALLVILAFFFAPAAIAANMTQSEAETLALAMLTDSGRNCGMIAVPNCGNGELLKAFWTKGGGETGNPKLIVDGFTNNATSLTAAQAKVSALNLAGRNLYARSGNLTTAAYSMPYADHFIDFLAVTGLTSSTLANVSYAEIERVLSPGAKAWVGAATSESTGLSAANLTAWIAGNHTLSNATVVSDSTGNWAVITKIARIPDTFEGVQGFTPSGNRFYDDKVLTWPVLPQWFSKPDAMYMGPILNCIGAAGGRFYADYSNGSYSESRSGLTPTYIAAHNVYNGQRLWLREGPTATTAVYSQGCVAYDKIIDGKTGLQIGTIPFPAGWADASPMDSVRTLRLFFVENDILYAVGYANAVNTLFAYDLINQTTLYTVENFMENSNIEWRTVRGLVASEGKLYGRSGTSIYSYNLSNGSFNWKVTLPATVLRIRSSPNGVLATLDATTNLCFLNAADGSALWAKTFEYPEPIIAKSAASTFNGGKEFLAEVDAKGQVYDLLTGNYVTSIQYRGGRGCGTGMITPQGSWANSYGYTWDFGKNAKTTPASPYTENCGEAQFATSGLLLHQQNNCSCYGTFMGAKAEAPMGAFNPEQAAVPAERLEQGPAYSSLNASVVVDAKDWSTHRGNNNHSASTPVAINTSNCTLLWKYTNPNPYRYKQPSTDAVWAYETSTPAATAGGYVFVAGSDGLIKCLNAKNGTLVWSYQTGGWIFATPTVANGCVYVGSGDGYAYCLEAQTGRLVWRFRAAPAERRWSYYGHLISTWPILTGVLVHNGNAYFVSGMRDEWGVQAFCVNASTGSLVWQNTSAGVFLDNKPGLARYGHVPGGYMTVVGNNLWVKEPARQYPYIKPPAQRIRMGIFDLATGTISSADSSGGSNGRQIGLMGNYVVGWGEDFHSEMSYYQQSGQPTFAQTSPTGTPVKPFIKSSNYPDLPFLAWDDTDSFFSCNNTTKKISNSTFVDWLDATVVANSGSTWPVISTKISFPTIVGWSPVSLGGDLRAIALANNAFLEFNTAGELGIMNRETGAQLRKVTTGNSTTAVDLYLEGLAIDRGGKIIMVSRNGDVTCYGTNLPVIVTQLEGVSGIDVGEPFSLTIEAATTATGGNLTYQWYKNGVAISGATSSTYSKASAVEGDAGSYYVKVTNSAGFVNSTAVNVSLTVTTSITSPAAAFGFIQPVDITITANATSLKGAITKVEFYNTVGNATTLLGEDTTAPYSFTWANAPGGNATLTTKAYDALGSTGVSSPVSISVAPLLAYLQFNETSGLTAVDSSSAGNNGTISHAGTSTTAWKDAQWFAQSIFNGGLRFCATANFTTTATKQGVTVSPLTDATHLTGLGTATSNFTVGFWINSGLNYKLKHIFTFKDTAVVNTNDSFLDFGSGDSLTTPGLFTRKLTWMTTAATPAKIISANTHTAPDGQWDHYTIVATPDNVKWYVNGILFDTLLPTSSNKMRVYYKDFIVGNKGDFLNGFNGFIDDVKLFGTALTANQVVTLATQYPYEIMPSITLTAPAEGTVITASNNVTMTANVTVNHYPATVTYYANGTEIGSSSTPPFTYNWTTMVAGNYTITANMTDGLLHSATSNSRNFTFTPVSIPTVNTEGGTFTLAQTISVATADSGAEIRYTTDGTVPTASSPLIVGGSYTVTQSMILKLRAFKAGVAPSDVKTVIFTIGTQLATGESQAMMVTEGGNLWGFGFNLYNAVGIGDGSNLIRDTLLPVDTITNVTAIAAGTSHSLAVKSDNTVWAWGYNSEYQLGYHTTTGISNSTKPIQVFGLPDVVSVAACAGGSFALAANGTVWSWGSNVYGQLGTGGQRQTAVPTQMNNLTGIKAIAAKNFNFLALKNDGTVWACGANSFGQLGNNSTYSYSANATQVSGLTGIFVAIAIGTNHGMALRDDGTVWAWGSNLYGQLGDGTQIDRLLPVQMTGVTGVKAIAASPDSSIALMTNGTLYGTGRYGRGSLGTGQIGSGTDDCVTTMRPFNGSIYYETDYTKTRVVTSTINATGLSSNVTTTTNSHWLGRDWAGVTVNATFFNAIAATSTVNGTDEYGMPFTTKTYIDTEPTITEPLYDSGTGLQNGIKVTTVTYSPMTMTKRQVPTLNDVAFVGMGLTIGLATTTNGTLYQWSKASALSKVVSDVNPPASFGLVSQTVSENGSATTFTAKLWKPLAQDVTIPFTTSGTATQNVDYTISTSPIVIPAGSTIASFTITPINDMIYRGDRSVIVQMGTPTNAALGERDVTTLNITEDDPMPIVSFTTANQSAVESGGNITITAQLTAPHGKSIVTVPYTIGGTAVNPTNFTIAPNSTVSIPVGATSANITVSPKYIAGYSGDVTVILNMGVVTNAVKGEPNIHTLTITDKELSITSQPSAQEVSWGETATFSVTALGTAPTYQWRKNGVPIEGATSASYTTPVVGIPDNGSVFDVVVSNATDSVTSTPAALTVLYNEAPTVSFTFPVSPAIYPSAPADVILRTDIFTNGEIVKLEFFAEATKIGETDGALSKGTTWYSVAAGNYTVTARVTDNQGQMATSTPITVEVQGTSDPFASWATLSGLSGNQTLATANPSGDGISNLIKYALGLNPNAITRGLTNGTTPGLPLVAVEGDNLTLTYQKDTTKTDITYTVESSSDLVTWSTASISEALQTTVGDIQTKKASVPIGTDKKEYIRLKVTK